MNFMSTMDRKTRTKERRYFPRVNYRATAELVSRTGRWPVQIVDLSFNGALVASPYNHQFGSDEDLTLYVFINSGDQIKMRGRLAHTKGKYLGIECKPSNVDNSTLLRRLLNEQTQKFRKS